MSMAGEACPYPHGMAAFTRATRMPVTLAILLFVVPIAMLVWLANAPVWLIALGALIGAVAGVITQWRRTSSQRKRAER